MNSLTPSLDLMEFVEQNILPRYASFDKAHRLSHVNDVISRSLKLARHLGADINMVYVVAAYHDLGLEGPRAIHHLTSGRILASDARLRRWFSPEQINMMRQAVEDHRASASHAPRNLYGRIVAEADRDLTPSHVFRRTVQFGLDHYPQMTHDEHWRRFQQHMNEKYAVNGYIQLWLPDSESQRNLTEIRRIIENPAELRQEFEKYWQQEHTDSTTPG